MYKWIEQMVIYVFLQDSVPPTSLLEKVCFRRNKPEPCGVLQYFFRIFIFRVFIQSI